MTITRATESPRFELPGVVFTGLAAPSRGSSELCTWRLTVAPGLVPGALHRLDHDEVFMIVSGRVTLTPDGDVLGPGDTAVIRAGSPIALGNAGEEPAEIYVAIKAGFTATMADGTAIGTPPWAQ
jgi:mannose-6-phosphate isomerase-like protein (cupin superfamily)